MKSLIYAASALALALPGALSAHEPTTSSASTPTTGDVSASTSGSAEGTPDSVQAGGTADATAADGGTAETSGTARFNEHMANQRSTATASDEDERARSMTRSHASTKGADVSHSMSIYKQRGEKPVITREHNVTTPTEKAEGDSEM